MLTFEDLRTYEGYQLELGVTHEIPEDPNRRWQKTLCSDSLFNWYLDPLLAAIWDASYARYQLRTDRQARLFEAEASGQIVLGEDLKVSGGSDEITLLREIPVLEISRNQRVTFAILCAQEVTDTPTWGWRAWADKWLSGEDRTEESARKAGDNMGALEGGSAESAAAWAAQQAARHEIYPWILAEEVGMWANQAAVRSSMQAQRRNLSPLDFLAIAKRAVEKG